jgi:hypothetical protein
MQLCDGRCRLAAGAWSRSSQGGGFSGLAAIKLRTSRPNRKRAITSSKTPSHRWPHAPAHGMIGASPTPTRTVARSPLMQNARAFAILPAALVLAMLAPTPLAAQTRVTTPREALGHDFGDDYFLASYAQIAEYWRTLDRESDRMVLREIGRTAGGRPHLMAIVTSPANHAMLEHYRDISSRLAHAEGLTEEQARALAHEGKAVVWIDGGLHASESLGAQQLGEMVWQMVSREDDETRRMLDDVIILFVHANPDGNDLVADWYMRRADPLQRSLSGLPELYQKYIGHDNNRDFFASTQAETENINRVLYHEWFPQLLYNHHQSGPAGTIFWSPPLRDPYNFNLDPMSTSRPTSSKMVTTSSAHAFCIDPRGAVRSGKRGSATSSIPIAGTAPSSWTRWGFGSSPSKPGPTRLEPGAMS